MDPIRVVTEAEQLAERAPNGSWRKWPPPWTRPQLLAYATARVRGVSAAKALVESNPFLTRFDGPKRKMMARVIDEHPVVVAETARLRLKMRKADLMTDVERRETLAVIARTPVTEFVGKDLTDPGVIEALGRKSLALKKVKKTVRSDENGETVTTEFETWDRIQALTKDAEMAGELEPSPQSGSTAVHIYQQIVNNHGAQGRGLLPVAPEAPAIDLQRGTDSTAVSVPDFHSGDPGSSPDQCSNPAGESRSPLLP